MASAQFLEDALFKDVDESDVNAIVGSLENQLETPSSSQNTIGINNQSQNNVNASGSAINGVQKFIISQTNPNELKSVNFAVSNPNTRVSYSNLQGPVHSTYINVSQSLQNSASKSNDPVKVIYSQTSQSLVNPVTSNIITIPHSLSNGSIGLAPQNFIQSVPQASVGVNQNFNKSLTMQPPLVIKQGTTTGQVGIQPGMVTVPMTVNSSMSGSIQNVMTLTKSAGQTVVPSSQTMGGNSQPTIIPNVQILNMRPGAPGVTAPKSVATVSPRVVIGAPQVVGSRPAAPGITLQTLQGLQPGQQGHLLLKTENGQYQLLRVGPAPAASTLAAPPGQTIRLSTVPAHPGVATVSTSVATPQMQPQQMAGSPVPAPMVAASVASPSPVSQPAVTTQKPSDNTKEKCRNFLANLLDLSSKEPKSVERNVRNLIQELIDAQVEPEEFCDRLERLLNASPQPCLIGFLKKSLPLLRQSLVTKELIIEGINPPSPHVAFSTGPTPPAQATLAGTNMHLSDYDSNGSSGSNGHTLTTLMPALPCTMPSSPTMHYNIISPTMQVLNSQSDYDSNGSSGNGHTLTTLMPCTMPSSPTMHYNIISSPTMQVINSQSDYDSNGSSGSNGHTLTTLMPALPCSMPSSPTMQTYSIISSPTMQVLPSVLNSQNTPLQSQPLKVNKVSSPKSSMSLGKGYRGSPQPSAALSTVLTPGKSLLRDKEKKATSQYSSQQFADDKMAGDDDINDVAAMGGVNLAEESQRILGSTELIGTQIRSCKDECLVPSAAMQSRLKIAAASHGLEEPSAEVTGLISHAVHERLKNIVEKLAVIAQHRIDMADSKYEVTQDVKGQLKFLEELDRVEKKRREDSERELLLRAAKSRSKNEDPEQAKLKAKAKEMQRAELEELRQREANLTALQAIGPRKKPKLEGGSNGGGDSANTTSSQSNFGMSSRSQMALRTRLKRINQRDLIHLMEQERDTSHSHMLYSCYLK
ncbi:transcription initiation factor TFIID subunit 4 isoform X2 [Plutella xylostella]|uniref:transcription initiation factor TFIID subunit 4 isoform X2 n=1 Tax=Plutella xylostella TaxID=51655 RepID=UPI002032A3AD|nr:transcription initiation factor TFIID subunit 4 isoform X2 [Plutella xylostella]